MPTGKPRKPTAVLALNAASFKNNAARLAEKRGGEPDPLGEIGDPPDYMDPIPAACWREIVGLAHRDTLCTADRVMMEHGATLLAHCRAHKWMVAPASIKQMENFLARLGMTPADRSRVKVIRRTATKDALDEFTTPLKRAA